MAWKSVDQLFELHVRSHSSQPCTLRLNEQLASPPTASSRFNHATACLMVTCIENAKNKAFARIDVIGAERLE
ncbi:MAG: hypothetical protein OES79_07585 [Planctomycetota bacterium]|nr:hypothetical protein [Planctomycetota bacterium]